MELIHTRITFIFSTIFLLIGIDGTCQYSETFPINNKGILHGPYPGGTATSCAMPVFTGVKKAFLFFVFIFFVQIILAQDSTAWKFSYNLEASGLHLNPKFTSQEILIDPVIYRKRRSNNVFRPRREFVTDNPNFHTASYLGIKLGTSFQEKYKFQSNLYFEHRGASYGFNDRDNMVWFPQFMFSAKDTFQVFKKEIVLEINAGHYVEAQVNNGLKIYNQDYQGINFRASYQKFFFEYHQIGDLANQIGLNLEEYFHLAIGFENERFRLVFSQNQNLPSSPFFFEKYWDSDISFNYFFPNQVELYFQYGHRHFDQLNLVDNGAFVLGAKYSLTKNDKVHWNIHPAIRYYSANYNEGHYDPSFTYRDPSKELYANTVGRFLYPLRNYYYAFDRWAVHTEYQGEHIYSIALKTNLNVKLFDRIGLLTDVETLSIHRENDFYTNYFYAMEFYYTVRKNFRFGFMISNKTYNLDASFPTFYMMKKPMLGIHLKLDAIR